MTTGGGEVLDPVQVEQFIQQVMNDIARGVKVVSEAHARKLKADRAFDVAFATAHFAAQGPAGDRKYAATLATQQERIDRDAAEVAYRHAERQMKALEGQLSGFQSINKTIQQMLSGAAYAGRGQ